MPNFRLFYLVLSNFIFILLKQIPPKTPCIKGVEKFISDYISNKLKNMKILKSFMEALRFNAMSTRGEKYKISEIKHFTPLDDKTMPYGHSFQKGGWMLECRKNKESFKTENYQYFINENFDVIEAIAPDQYGLSDYRGGIIIFSTDANSLEVNENKLLNWVIQKTKALENRFFSKTKLNKVVSKFDSPDNRLRDDIVEDYIGAFSIGNFFSGRYIDDNSKVFDENSLGIEINGISPKGLIYMVKEIAREFEQETVLVKDLNANKIFLVSREIGVDVAAQHLNK